MANPKLREWVEANRQALELFLQGAEQPDARSRPENPSIPAFEVSGSVD